MMLCKCMLCKAHSGRVYANKAEFVSSCGRGLGICDITLLEYAKGLFWDTDYDLWK